MRGSLFRAAYELFYTPIPAKEKRAAKSLIDVGFDRLGEAMGGGLVRLLLLAPLAFQYNAIMSSAVICSVVALLVASRLNRGYIETLERSLLHRAVELELSDVGDNTTRTALMRTIIRPLSASRVTRPQTESAPPPTTMMGAQGSSPRGLDADLLQIMALRSKDRDRILRVLQSDDGLPGLLVPHVIPLLAWDPVANASIDALRKVAEEHIGELVDALIDPNQDFAVRRRLARVFAVCVSQRAADGLLLGLDDLRFEVRFQCGRSLASIVEKNPRIRIDREKVLDVVLREVAVGRPVWESHQLLDRLEDTGPSSFVDDFLKDRASRSLSHVFTLLSLVLPAEPLQIAFRGLHTDDQNLRGTALEYLEGVLPPQVRDRLWPFLEDTRAARGAPRSRDEIVADLLRSNESIVVNLEELKRRVSTSRTGETWQRT
jgi:hypothetical protein